MRPRENLTASGAGIGLFVLLSLIVLLITDDAESVAAEARPGSSSSMAPRGLRRLRVALAQAGHPVDRITDETPVVDPCAILIVEPAKRPARFMLWDLEMLVEGGHATLIVAGSAEEILRLPGGLLPRSIPGTVLEDSVIGISEALPFSPRIAGFVSRHERLGGIWVRYPVSAFSTTIPGTRTIAQTTEGRPVVVLYQPEGSGGRVILCSEPRIFENQWIDQLENIELACGLLATEARVAFDERWLEDEDVISKNAVMSLIYGTGAGRGLVILGLGVMLAIYLRGLQPGGPPLRRMTRRHPTEYVDSMAELTLAAGPPELIVRHFQARFRRRACRSLGLPTDADPAELARRLALRTGEDVERIRATLTLLPRADDRVPEFVKRLDSWERSL